MGTEFVIEGPYAIPVEKKNGTMKWIDKDQIAEFWSNEEVGPLAEKQGCYVFAMKAAKGFKPWYVGKASKTLHQECFAPRKPYLFNSVLANGGKGTPVMFFVVRPGNRKKVPKKVLDEIEKWLIVAAADKNPDLRNTQHKKPQAPWRITGVVNSGPGKPSGTASSFKKMMGI